MSIQNWFYPEPHCSAGEVATACVDLLLLIRYGCDANDAPEEEAIDPFGGGIISCLWVDGCEANELPLETGGVRFDSCDANDCPLSIFLISIISA
mmetsp:Transcript_35393/g.51990  ORF Transcript_35393/g.51990 Transcript_35393/m.51990 type:complete len:95 (+) Transcript_35393:430-714(+)